MMLNQKSHFSVRLSQNDPIWLILLTQRMTLKVPPECHLIQYLSANFLLAVYIPITGTPGMNGLFKVPAPPPPSNPLKMSPIQQNGAFRSSIQLTTPLSTGSMQRNPPIGGSPDAEDDSSQGSFAQFRFWSFTNLVSTVVPISGVTVHPSLPSRPAFASSSTQEDVHRKALISLAVPMRSREPNREASRPAKVRRVSGDEFGRSDECIPRIETNSIVDTPSTTHSRRSDALRAEGVASAKKDKGKSREAQNEFTTPAMTRTSGQKRIEDYSAFKGNGRYGKDVESNRCVVHFLFLIQSYHIFSRAGDTTINAQYTIDPNQNGGLNYQYDLVVRNRDERRRLDAGDCECCREVNADHSFTSFGLLTFWKNLVVLRRGWTPS